MTADAMHSGTPRTEKWLEWCNRDARYKAPEQAYETVCKHVGVMTDFARQLETENAALIAALEDMTDRFERVCPDVAGYIDESDVKRIKKARAALERARKGA